MRRTNEDEDDASTIDAVTASIKAFFPYLMVPQDAVEKVEGFLILNQAARRRPGDRVIVIVRDGGLCLSTSAQTERAAAASSACRALGK